MIVEDKIMEASTRDWVGDTKEILTRTLPGGMEDVEDTTDNAGTDKVVAAEGFKGEVGV